MATNNGPSVKLIQACVQFHAKGAFLAPDADAMYAQLQRVYAEEHAKTAGKVEAAAPDLLAALVDVLGWYDLSDVAELMAKKGEQAEHQRTITAARAALKKKAGQP